MAPSRAACGPGCSAITACATGCPRRRSSATAWPTAWPTATAGSWSASCAPRAWASWRASRGASTGWASARSSSASRGSPEAPRVSAGTSEAEHAAALADEGRRLRRLRTVVDLTTSVLMQGRLSRREAEELVAAARVGILDLFPDKESTYELILAPRFARLLEEFVGPGPRVLPFRKP